MKITAFVQSRHTNDMAPVPGSNGAPSQAIQAQLVPMYDTGTKVIDNSSINLSIPKVSQTTIDDILATFKPGTQVTITIELASS